MNNILERLTNIYTVMFSIRIVVSKAFAGPEERVTLIDAIPMKV